MKSDKKQTYILIGVFFFILAGLFLYLGLSQPKVSSQNVVQETTLIGDVSSTAEFTTIKSQGENSNSSESVSSSSSKTATTSGKTANVSYPLNLNTCTAEELKTINGIGETRANAIISYRNHLGSYSSVDQIKDISGIGDATYEKVAPYLTV